METNQGNKLIAEFMGWKNIGMKNLELWIRNERDLGLNTDQLKFHSDWNWLMPVVQKCRDMNHYQYKYKSIEIMLCSLDLQGVWGAVVEFIQWYNQNSKS